MNSIPKLIASIAALIASLALLWFAFTASNLAVTTNKFVQNISGRQGIRVAHDGEVTLNEYHF
jgi:hypothetical protein